MTDDDRMTGHEALKQFPQSHLGFVIWTSFVIFRQVPRMRDTSGRVRIRLTLCSRVTVSMCEPLIAGSSSKRPDCTPRVSVPAYSLSSLMSKSCTLVPRPIVKRSKPVAIGSSVPQWPTFLISIFRRTSATASCEVIPSALSTSRTPSRLGLNDVTNFLQNVPFDFGECSAHACARREGMPPAAKFLTDGTDINSNTFRAPPAPNLAV